MQFIQVANAYKNLSPNEQGTWEVNFASCNKPRHADGNPDSISYYLPMSSMGDSDDADPPEALGVESDDNGDQEMLFS